MRSSFQVYYNSNSKIIYTKVTWLFEILVWFYIEPNVPKGTFDFIKKKLEKNSQVFSHWVERKLVSIDKLHFPLESDWCTNENDFLNIKTSV